MTPNISIPNIQNFRDEAFSNEYLTKLIGLDTTCTDSEFIKSVINSDMNGALGFQYRVRDFIIEHVISEVGKVN